ncbi:tetratricopeptide repeat protein [Paraburkholderia sediminicola]|uniref:tetratricopeptide repeat-containing glycosyltransferase family protein n=1 Tax=Paraburkholderia sediminicola TaxID=458836 RepID=UPI0038BBEDCE
MSIRNMTRSSDLPSGGESVNTLVASADAHFAAGRTQEAMLEYERALEQHPQHVHALHRMGLACFREDQVELSRQYLDEALTVAPERADIWEHRGLLAALQGEPVAAEAFYHRALDLSGDTASLHRNLADCLKLSGRLAEARMHYEKALELDPGLQHAVRALARISTECERFAAAADLWVRVWALESSRLHDGLELIAALWKAGRDTQIDAVLAQLRTRFSTDAAALEQVAFTLNNVHRFQEAADVIAGALALDSQRAGLHHNASYVCNMLGDFSQMRLHAAEAARLLPDNAHIQFNLAAAQLRSGDFEHGWKLYRWHEALPGNHDLFRPNFPEWQGEPVAGRRFLLIGEQGLGDQIQFLRLAEWLNRQGALVDVWVSAPLAELACGASGVHGAWTEPPPGSYDFWCRMFRMPEHMKLTLPMLPVAMPYLAAEQALARRWQQRIGATDSAETHPTRKKRIGLVWAGNPAYGLDRCRSVELSRLLPILAQHVVQWISLQMGQAQDEAAALPANIDMQMLGPEISNFSDTLAILQSLDLVITVDTSVAHLAGAAGRPVWILLPTCTDWRWMADRDDSPWYPSARLFRQRELDRWDTVLDDVQTALRDYVAG